MKTKSVRAVFVVPALALLGIMFALGQPKGDTVTVKGEVIDLWCYLEGGDHGAEHKIMRDQLRQGRKSHRTPY